MISWEASSSGGDAQNFQRQLRERFAQFNLELAEEKTRLLLFGRFAAVERGKHGQRPETFEFLGFKHVCGVDRSGRFALIRIPSTKSCRKFLARTREWLLATQALEETRTTAAPHGDAARLLPVLRLAPLRPKAELDPPRSPATVEARPATPRSTTSDELGAVWAIAVVRAAVRSQHCIQRSETELFANVIWGARCGKSARRVLLGETSSRSHARLGEGTGAKASATARLRKGLPLQGSSLPSPAFDLR